MAITAIERILGIYEAGEDLSDKQYYAVKLNNQSRWVLASTDQDAQGILINKPTNRQVCKVVVDGVTKALCGGNFNPSDSLSVDANGKLVKATTGIAVAWATEKGTAGRIASVFVSPRGKPDLSFPIAVSTPIAPGDTEIVDTVDLSLTRGVKWSLVVEDTIGMLYSGREILAHHNNVQARDSQFAIQGDYMNHQVNVVFNPPYLELQVTNGHTNDIIVSAAAIEIAKAI